MATNNYTTKTAALKATIADVSKINTKKLKVNGKDVVLGAKHPEDTREVITENDLWGSWVEIKDGEIIFHDDEVTNPNINSTWNENITKVEKNKAFIGDDFYCNIQTEKIIEASGFFMNSQAITSFDSDLSSVKGFIMCFSNCTNLISFNGSLRSLEQSRMCFNNCTSLTTFTSDLSSLTSGLMMF